MKTVTLSKPLLGGKVTKFTFREPRFADFMELGDPRVPIPTGDGDKVYMRPVPETIRQYAERLVESGPHDEAALLGSASLRDSFAIQGAIRGFFRDAESPEPEKSTNSPGSDGTSPSEPKSPSPTSAA